MSNKNVLIRAGHHLVVSPKITANDINMIQITTLYLDWASRKMALDGGWTQSDLEDPTKVFSFAQFIVRAAEKLPYINIFHGIESLESGTNPAPMVIDFLETLVYKVSDPWDISLEASLKTLMSPGNSEASATTLMNNWWKEVCSSPEGIIFSLSPISVDADQVKTTLGATGIGFKTDTWAKCLITQADKKKWLRSTAIGISFHRPTWETCQDDMKKMLEKVDPNWSSRVEDARFTSS